VRFQKTEIANGNLFLQQLVLVLVVTHVRLKKFADSPLVIYLFGKGRLFNSVDFDIGEMFQESSIAQVTLFVKEEFVRLGARDNVQVEVLDFLTFRVGLENVKLVENRNSVNRHEGTGVGLRHVNLYETMGSLPLVEKPYVGNGMIFKQNVHVLFVVVAPVVQAEYTITEIYKSFIATVIALDVLNIHATIYVGRNELLTLDLNGALVQTHRDTRYLTALEPNLRYVLCLVQLPQQLLEVIVAMYEMDGFILGRIRI
jgi:hypothetical protein